MRIQSDFKILWVDSDPGAVTPLLSSLEIPDERIDLCSSAAEALDMVRRRTYAAVVCDQSMAQMTGVTFLAKVKEISPLSTRVLASGLLAESVAEDAINEAQVFRLIAKPLESSKVEESLRASLRQFERASSKSHLMKEISQQNRKLEELTTGLEQLVEERTKHIEQSKNQVERNLAEMRKLVLFIKDLSGLTALDELLPLLREEIKKFHHVQKPILCYPSFEGQLKILYFRGRDVVEKDTAMRWPDSNRLRINQNEDREYLANIFSRPFAKVIAVPLSRNMMEDRPSDVPAVVFIEHDLAEDKVDYFIRFISQRLQPMSIAVDRVILEYQAKFVSYQWESTFDGIETPVAIIDSEKKLLRSNRSFGEGTRGDSCHKILAGKDSVCLGCPVNQAVATLASHSSRIHAKGRIYDVYSYPIHLQGDLQATNVINHYVDMTDSRKLYSKVVQTEKLAAIGSLAGNIAHELNNPLTGIKSLSEVLLDEFGRNPPDSENLTEDLLEVKRAAARSQVIIKNLLEFSNPEEEGVLSVVPLNDIVQRTLPLLKTALHSHRSDIELTGQANWVKVNVPLMQQVLFNLVTNACQAMEEMGTLSVTTRIVDSGGVSWVQLEIKDTGKGIPREVMQHIFEPFFTTKEEGRGTGLGLSMSRSIIDRYGGRIAVTSEMNVGTVFSVLLPKVEGE